MESPGASSQIARDLVGKGQKTRSVGDLAGAATAFAEAARVAPDWPAPAFLHCLALLEGGAPAAGSCVQGLLSRFPDHAPGWEELGLFLLRAGQPEAALMCLWRAAAVAPNFQLAMHCGSALQSLGRSSAARAAFAEACAMNPRSERAQFLFAVSAQDEHDLPVARDAYRRALALNPKLAEASVNLGIVLQALGDLDAAKLAYGTAMNHRTDTFGRVSQAMTTAAKGELWLDLGRLRRHLTGLPGSRQSSGQV